MNDGVTLSGNYTGVFVERAYFVYSNPLPSPTSPQKCCSHYSRLFFGGGGGGVIEIEMNSISSLHMCPMTDKQMSSFICSGWLSWNPMAQNLWPMSTLLQMQESQWEDWRKRIKEDKGQFFSSKNIFCVYVVWEGVGCSAKLFQLLLMSFFTSQRSAVTFFFFILKGMRSWKQKQSLPLRSLRK